MDGSDGVAHQEVHTAKRTLMSIAVQAEMHPKIQYSSTMANEHGKLCLCSPTAGSGYRHPKNAFAQGQSDLPQFIFEQSQSKLNGENP